MIRGEFAITDPVISSGLTLPNGPVLEAGSQAGFAYAGRRAWLARDAAEPAIKAGLYPGFEMKFKIQPDPREAQHLRAGMRRVLDNDAIEQAVVLHELPAIIWQWNADQGAVITVDAIIRPPGESDWEWNHTFRTLEIRAASEHTLLMAFSHAVDWRIESVNKQQRIAIRAKIDVRPEEPIILAVAAGTSPAELTRKVARLEQPQLLLSARRTATIQQDTQQPHIETPDPAVNRTLQWSAHLAVSATVETNDGRVTIPGYNAPALGLTLLALGDAAGARALMTNAAIRNATTDQLPLYLLLAARYLAWTADFDFMYGEWPHVLAALDRVVAGEAAGSPVLQNALRELTDAAASLGDEATRTRLTTQMKHRVSRDSTETQLIPGAINAIPIAGGRSGTRIATFRRFIEERSPYTFAALMHGLAGVEPDAPKNRVRIQPAIPSEWESFDLTNIHLGDARLDLRYRRGGNTHTFRLRQSAGAIPVRAVFEPLVPTSTVEQILLDGQPAQLDIRRSGECVITPIQLDLDFERVLEIEGG